MNQQQKNKITKALAHLRIALFEANPQKTADDNLHFDITINDCKASVDGEEFDITWEVDEILRRRRRLKYISITSTSKMLTVIFLSATS
jgi:hypothetical protein